jgi:chemotaxis signal transduction protein
MIEIVEVPEVTVLPGSHAWLLGVTEIRNALTWVVALDGDRRLRTKLVRLAPATTRPNATTREVAIAIDASAAFATVLRSAEQRPSPLQFTTAATSPMGPAWLLNVRALFEANQ